MDERQWIGVRSPESRAISERINVATRLSSKLSGLPRHRLGGVTLHPRCEQNTPATGNQGA
jgi:hypothetical protein